MLVKSKASKDIVKKSQCKGHAFNLKKSLLKQLRYTHLYFIPQAGQLTLQ